MSSLQERVPVKPFSGEASTEVDIITVRSKKEHKQFVNFLYELYKNNPHWAPPFRSDELKNMSKEKNPSHAYCDSQWFLAKKNGKIVGRVGAIHHKSANSKWGKNIVRFTRFDFIDDPDVSAALLKAVEDWGKERGLTDIQGPMGFSDLDQEGMLIDGFEEEGTFVTLYNYPYYVDHLKRHGFTKATDWIEFQITVPPEPNKKVEKIAKMVSKRFGYRLVEFERRKDVIKLAPEIFEVLEEAYKELYGTAPMTQREINDIISQFFGFINPHFIKVVMDKNDKVAGFGITFPSLAKAARKSNGRLFPFGFLRFVRAINKNDKLALYLVGVRPELRGQGVNAIMMDAITKTAIRYGMTIAESNPELEDNDKVQSQWKFYDTRQHRRRRCWTKKMS